MTWTSIGSIDTSRKSVGGAESRHKSDKFAAATHFFVMSGDDEQRWVDAAIRWDDHQDDADEESDDERDAFDPFKQDPSQSFSFTFRVDADADAREPKSTAGTCNADGAAAASSSSQHECKCATKDKDDEDDATISAAGSADDGAAAASRSSQHESKSATKNKDADDDATISIQLSGYKYDSDETFNSTGLTLWRAAEHLCQYTIRRREELRNRRLCELGCGLGLCGILAHRLTSMGNVDKAIGSAQKNETEVYLTDGDTDALAQLRANVRQNAPPADNGGNNAGTIRCNQLIWGRENTVNFLGRHCSNRPFDILLASDVVYVADIIAPLMETVQTLLAPEGVFWFAYCSRRNVPVKIDLVLEAVLEAGLVYDCVEEVDGIMIYEIRWGKSGDNGEKIASATTASSTDSNEPVRPFEWLTNFSSLSRLLVQTYLFPGESETKGRGRALHVGCGTSTLGECMVEELGYEQVVNADVDRESLSAMEKRWNERCARNDKSEILEAMEWQEFDFGKITETSSDAAFQSGYFDVVVDKSTLDCALCSGDGAAGMIVEAYNALRSDGGVYVCISFNHVDFVGRLLKDCPGADWDVEHVVVKRKVDVPEHLAGRLSASTGLTSDSVGDVLPTEQPNLKQQNSAWADGSFDPDDDYRRQCNVFICRRRKGSSATPIYFNAVRDHLHRVNDAWFQTSNPMVTHTREADLRAAFEARADGGTLPLKDCYAILFTDAEREHLTYEFFLEDWAAFHESHGDLSRDSMTVDTALQFLKEMQ